MAATTHSGTFPMDLLINHTLEQLPPHLSPVGFSPPPFEHSTFPDFHLLHSPDLFFPATSRRIEICNVRTLYSADPPPSYFAFPTSHIFLFPQPYHKMGKADAVRRTFTESERVQPMSSLPFSPPPHTPPSIGHRADL